MRLTRRTWTAAALVVLTLASAAYVFRRPIGYSLLYFLGRSEACRWDDIQRALADDPAKAVAGLDESCRQVSADERGYEFWNTPLGDFWVPPANGARLPWLLSNLRRHHDRSEACRLRTGDVVLDCGAHVGLFAREALASGARLVVAIEPAAENVECLRRNFAAEIRDGRVKVYPKGVWDKEATLTFEPMRHFSAGAHVAQEPRADVQVQRIPVTTIDLLAAELGLDQVDFIKLHVEGSEQQALEGARRIVAQFHPRLAVACDHRDDDRRRIPEIVLGIRSGYQMRAAGLHVERSRMLLLPHMLFFVE
jgi:FkbM family methyltransferase